MTDEPLITGYAAQLLREVGARIADEIQAATTPAEHLVPEDRSAWPACWRQARCALELCRRAAELAARR